MSDAQTTAESATFEKDQFEKGQFEKGQFEKGKGGHPGGPAAITPRNVHFDAVKDVDMRDWHSGNTVLSAFFNGLSLSFPDGEAFFVNAVRAHAKDVSDPELRKHVKGFMTQESIHSREHDVYNDQLLDQGFGRARGILAMNKRWLDFVEQKLGRTSALADTCAAEHFTAILADMLLSDERFMGDANPDMAKLWRWHAIEETEHKAVAFDVFKTAYPGARGYFIRCSAMALTAFFFPLGMVLGTITMLRDKGDLYNWKDWGKALKWFWARPAFFPRMMLRVLPYFKPSFHPWDEQNYHYVEDYNKAATDAA
ncbi:MAG: metal-dependent hydrolase [Alphaproteobacteria bacterium]